MIRYIIFLLILINHNKVIGQSILANKTKYQVKISSPNFYTAVIPLQNGDKETFKNVKLTLSSGELSKKDIDRLLDLDTYEELNSKARERCKNPYSWKPREIRISGRSSEEVSIVRFYGSAENTFGSRIEVDFWFEYLDGYFFKLNNPFETNNR